MTVGTHRVLVAIVLFFILGPLFGPSIAGPFHQAVKSGDSVQARALITPGLDINERDAFGMAAIHYAVYQGHNGLVEMLLDTGAEVNIAVYSSEVSDRMFAPLHKFAPLHIAINLNEPEIANLLIARGANVNQETDDGQTALHLAARKGKDALVKTLIESGSDINARDFEEYTPLHSAAWNGYLEIVQVLVNQGADVNATGYDGRTPYQCATRKKRTEVIAFLEQLGFGE